LGKERETGFKKEKGMKLIIAGSRTFDNYELLCEIMDRVVNNVDVVTEVVCGGATGADSLGKRWADENSVPVKFMLADWTAHGKAAGPIRNAAMGEYADALLAFWDGKSPGTKNMIKCMKLEEKPYKIINFGGAR
jgi:hypothetical protein